VSPRYVIPGSNVRFALRNARRCRSMLNDLTHTFSVNIHRRYVRPILCAIFLTAVPTKVATVNYDYLQCKSSECPLWKDEIAFAQSLTFMTRRIK
jgi:hypothetical protein